MLGGQHVTWTSSQRSGSSTSPHAANATCAPIRIYIDRSRSARSRTLIKKSLRFMHCHLETFPSHSMFCLFMCINSASHSKSLLTGAKTRHGLGRPGMRRNSRGCLWNGYLAHYTLRLRLIKPRMVQRSTL